MSRLLYRQVHPSFVHDGRVASAAFRPTPKDEAKLSVDDAALTTAEGSWTRFVEAGHSSAGVWAVSHGECDENDVGVASDPLPDNPAHTLIDFSDHSRSARKKIAKRLATRARDRGCQYRARPPRDT